jgi:hypothetical protein
MKILFFVRSTSDVPNVEGVLRQLAERGHDVLIVAEPDPVADASDLIGRLRRVHPGICPSSPPVVRFNGDAFLGFELRQFLDYLRYLGPDFVDATRLRERAAQHAPPSLIAALQRPWLRSRAARRIVRALLRWCDRAVPRDPAIDEFIREHDPSLVVVTPLVDFGSRQSEYVRSARALGIPTGLCAVRWDSLTSQGLIHDRLDVVAVWNESMKNDAVALHGVPSSRVVVTGAAPYDQWFKWRPRSSREAFCVRVGLRSDRAFVLYVCSSPFIAANELDYIRGWIRALRAGPQSLRDVGILIRPHPQCDRWDAADLRDLEQVAVFPATGASPLDEDSRVDYYDSIYHSTAVVGVNTSALLESMLVGRGVYTVLAAEFRDTQDATPHFRHLRRASAGVLHAARTLDEHLAQLDEAVRGLHDVVDGRRRFIEAFLRPNGEDVAAAPLLATALEKTAARGARRDDGPWWRVLVRPVVRRIAARVAASDRGQAEKAARQARLSHYRKANLANRRAERVAFKQLAHAEHALRKQREEARVAAEQQTREAIATRAYARYRDVREHVRRFSASNGHVPVLTVEEQQMVSGLVHLWEATPETIANLRRWCEPISAIGAADYEAGATELAARLKHDLSFLGRKVDRDLFVQEPDALGGFGFTARGERFNEDTVKYLKALVALHDGGVLPALRRTPQRRVVWEIGGGWGGFAYQFKTICPNVTYVVTGIPEQFLVSAVYLTALFPGACCRFYNPSSPDDVWCGWEDADFIFAPESALPSLRPPRVDLTVDIMSMRQMNESRVAAHVQRAFDFGSPYFYSLLPRASAEEDTARVWRPLECRYWTHPVPPRVDTPTADADDESAAEPEDLYAHLVGWRRLRV